jgi:primosomal protein N' (replication factor Y)
VPEIALTPQTVRRFAERFPGRVAVLHSGLSQGELFDQWHGIRDGRYDVVVGSRSAVFAPQPDLGLIVIDEEHEWTYKQQDPAPRYHARDVAAKLAELTDAVLIMGSATPDVVTYQQAMWGHHTLLELTERVRPVLDAAGTTLRVTTSTVLPPVEVVDMREELKSGNRSMFSRSLQLGLHQALNRDEQAILFLNRRGTAGFMQCRDCGFVPQCPACAIAMGFHRRPARGGGGDVDRLMCHQCNRSRRPYDKCPMCASPRLRPMGVGVEAVEEAVHDLLPGARTLRWDRDVTSGRNAHEEILASFVEGRADVLIGTQMVAKGLDLPAVTIVGVISADVGLHVPDFRSAERTFQLLTQVAGRAGRTSTGDDGPQRGRVVVQTYTPDNYAVVAAAQHDFASFFQQEVTLRREQAYPPFVRLARLVYAHTNAEYALQQAERMARQLKADIASKGLPGFEVMGPAPPHIPKWHGRFRQQLSVRAPDPTELLRDIALPEGWTLDVDPASLA